MRKSMIGQAAVFFFLVQISVAHALWQPGAERAVRVAEMEIVAAKFDFSGFRNVLLRQVATEKGHVFDLSYEKDAKVVVSRYEVVEMRDIGCGSIEWVLGAISIAVRNQLVLADHTQRFCKDDKAEKDGRRFGWEAELRVGDSGRGAPGMGDAVMSIGGVPQDIYHIL